MKICIPIWGLVNGKGELVYWAQDRTNCTENKWHKDEKLIPLQIVKRKK